MITYERLPQLLKLPIMRHVMVLTILAIMVSLSSRYAFLYQQQQQSYQNTALNQIQLLQALINRALGQHAVPDVNTLQLIVDSYAQQMDGIQVILFDRTGRPIALNEPEGETQQLRNLPVWQNNQQDSTVFAAGFVTHWQQLPYGYVLYARQPVEQTSALQTLWSYAMLIPVLLSVLYFGLMMRPLMRVFSRFMRLTRHVQNMDHLPFYQSFSLDGDRKEFGGIVDGVNRLSYRYHQKQQQLIQSREFQRHLVDESPDILLRLDAQGRVDFINASIERFYVGNKDQLLGQMLAHVVSPLDTEQQSPLLHLGESVQYVQVLVRLIGQEQIFDLWLTSFRDQQGQILGYSGVMHEVSRDQQALAKYRVRAESAQQKLTENEKMLATMSHELRTPLNGILGMAQLLRETPLNVEQSEYARTLYNSGQAMLRLVNDILDWSKLEAGKMLTENIEFDLLEMVTEVADLMAANAAQKSLELICFIDPACPRFVMGDPYRIRQILLNLLNNAIKFTPAGYVALNVRPMTSYEIEQQEGWQQQRDWILFRVSDSGVGIPKDRQADLFQFFAQADRSVSRRFGGTGLGLAISRGLTEAMHGHIQLFSKEGVGTTFSLYLPLTTQSDVPLYYRPKLLGSFTMIVFEPNPLNQQGLRRLFDSLSIDCEIHDDLTALALMPKRMFIQQKPLLLMDYELLQERPLKHYLNTYSILQDAYCILMSRKPLRSIPSADYEGFQGFLLKPLRVEHILAELVRATDLETDRFELPVAQDQQIKLMQEFFASIEHDTPVSKTSTEMTVLLAEDNIVNQKVASKMLQKMGCQVIVAENGRQAIELLEQHPEVRLVLMDCRMPEMDGLEATREIRRQMNSIPIVALTANDRDEDREACMEAGMDEFLAKPLQQQQLVQIIQRFR